MCVVKIIAMKSTYAMKYFQLQSRFLNKNFGFFFQIFQLEIGNFRKNCIKKCNKMPWARLARRITKQKKMCQQIVLLILTHLPQYYSKSLRAKSYLQPFLSHHQTCTRVGVCTPTLVQVWWQLKNGLRQHFVLNDFEQYYGKCVRIKRSICLHIFSCTAMPPANRAPQ